MNGERKKEEIGYIRQGRYNILILRRRGEGLLGGNGRSPVRFL